MSGVKLNAEQRKAVRHTGSALLVLAGAGSGKTGVITRRVAWLTQEHGVDPHEVVAVTFTNKAAREMKERVVGLVGKAAAKPLTVSTFHRFGMRVLREEAELLDYRPRFTLVDPKDAAVTVQEIMRGDALGDAETAERVQWRISRWKNLGLTTAPSDEISDPIGRTAQAIWPEYEARLHACNAFDLDDLIVKPARLFREYPDCLVRWQERSRYLLVDEYQDTNGAQYELVQLLAGDGKGLTVVGDDDQSIYAWRGAQTGNIARLADDFPGLQVVKLEQNYRSMGRILKAANSVISNNPRVYEKNLFSEAGYGDAIKVFQCQDDASEASTIVAEMMGHRFRKRTKWSDYAVLYRGNHQARAIEVKLREFNVPYRVSGGPSFFDRTEIRDVMSYLRLIVNTADDAAFLRIANRPRRGIGTTTLEALAKYAGESRLPLAVAAADPKMRERLNSRSAGLLASFAKWIDSESERAESAPAGSFVQELLVETGYNDWLLESAKDKEDGKRRQENVAELVGWLETLGNRPGKTLANVVADLILIGMLEREDKDDMDEVSLMTLHAAKGLEFDYVTIVGLEEGLLPHRVSVEQNEVDEERRLFYVGITRARRELTITFANSRRRQGRSIDAEPSRFLDELPADDLSWNGAGAAPPDREAGKAEFANLKAMLRSRSAEPDDTSAGDDDASAGGH